MLAVRIVHITFTYIGNVWMIELTQHDRLRWSIHQIVSGVRNTAVFRLLHRHRKVLGNAFGARAAELGRVRLYYVQFECMYTLSSKTIDVKLLRSMQSDGSVGFM